MTSSDLMSPMRAISSVHLTVLFFRSTQQNLLKIKNYEAPHCSVFSTILSFPLCNVQTLPNTLYSYPSFYVRLSGCTQPVPVVLNAVANSASCHETGWDYRACLLMTTAQVGQSQHTLYHNNDMCWSALSPSSSRLAIRRPVQADERKDHDPRDPLRPILCLLQRTDPRVRLPQRSSVRRKGTERALRRRL